MSSFAHHHLDLDEALEASLDAIEKDRQPEIGRPAQTDVFDSRKHLVLEQLQIRDETAARGYKSYSPMFAIVKHPNPDWTDDSWHNPHLYKYQVSRSEQIAP